MRTWLAGVGVAVGISLMGAAMLAQGQQSDASRPAAPAADAQRGDGRDYQHRDREGDDWRHGFRHRWFAAMRPEQFCRERFARRAGFLAYLQAKLDLTDAQKPLWDKYQQASLEVAQKHLQGCIENAGSKWGEMSALDRRQRIEQRLKARLDGLQATDQPLQDLYQALTPEQHKIVDHPLPAWEGVRR